MRSPAQTEALTVGSLAVEGSRWLLGSHIGAIILELFMGRAGLHFSDVPQLSFVRPITERFAPQLPALKPLSSV